MLSEIPYDSTIYASMEDQKRRGRSPTPGERVREERQRQIECSRETLN
jgi:hypothetical protein